MLTRSNSYNKQFESLLNEARGCVEDPRRIQLLDVEFIQLAEKVLAKTQDLTLVASLLEQWFNVKHRSAQVCSNAFAEVSTNLSLLELCLMSLEKHMDLSTLSALFAHTMALAINADDMKSLENLLLRLPKQVVLPAAHAQTVKLMISKKENTQLWWTLAISLTQKLRIEALCARDFLLEACVRGDCSLVQQIIDAFSQVPLKRKIRSSQILKCIEAIAKKCLAKKEFLPVKVLLSNLDFSQPLDPTKTILHLTKVMSAKDLREFASEHCPWLLPHLISSQDLEVEMEKWSAAQLADFICGYQGSDESFSQLVALVGKKETKIFFLDVCLSCTSRLTKQVAQRLLAIKHLASNPSWLSFGTSVWETALRVFSFIKRLCQLDLSEECVHGLAGFCFNSASEADLCILEIESANNQDAFLLELVNNQGRHFYLRSSFLLSLLRRGIKGTGLIVPVLLVDWCSHISSTQKKPENDVEILEEALRLIPKRQLSTLWTHEECFKRFWSSEQLIEWSDVCNKVLEMFHYKLDDKHWERFIRAGEPHDSETQSTRKKARLI